LATLALFTYYLLVLGCLSTAALVCSWFYSPVISLKICSSASELFYGFIDVFVARVGAEIVTRRFFQISLFSKGIINGRFMVLI